MRNLFTEFLGDSKPWEEATHYLFGSDLLIAPVVTEGTAHIPVYLPKGCNWIQVLAKKVYPGGQIYKIAVTLNIIPVFCKEGALLEHHLADIFGD